MAFTQSNRQIQITTPLGPDELLILSMTAEEALGRLFEFNIDLLSENPEIALDDLLGKRVTVEMDLVEGSKRYFDGFVSEFSQIGSIAYFAHYRVIVKPWLWFLTRTSDCRIFQQQTVPDIIKSIFRENGFTDFEDRLSGSYRNWEYCVQYRETDFNFVSRLMEQEGIHYFFKHEPGKHKLILCDSYSSHSVLEPYAEIPFVPPSEQSTSRWQDYIYGWQLSKAVQPGRYAHTDYDFEKPKADLLTNAPLPRQYEHSDYEVYDYPGEYLQNADGNGYARHRIEELQVGYEVLQGQANARGISVGWLYTLTEHPRGDQNREYLITEATHELQSDAFESVPGIAQGPVYDCRFSTMDSRESFRPARRTPKPMVQGPQTALVVGKAGEEIYTDEYGRVKVQFYWDRYGEKNENSSCWMRVAQVWAGKNWGAMHIPRIGQEVIVDFLEGDPDRPIITGRVYNADQMPPYGLPSNKTQSGIKSRSSKGGSSANFNEIRFEDKKGEEQVYIHAEKNQDNVVENDQTIYVGNDRAETIKRDRRLLVERDKFEEINRNKSILVNGGHSEKVDGSMDIMVGRNLTESIAINYAETVGAAMELTVGGLLAISVGASMSEVVGAQKSEAIGGSKSENIGANKSTDVGSNLNETVGKDKIVDVGKNQNDSIAGQHKISVGKEYILQAKKIQLVADDEIEIKTGRAEIVLKKNGDISVKGKKISVKGSSDVVIKGSKIKEN